MGINMDINYELYKVFYYVAKTLSFSEAAAELYISQSAVSQSIKVLEKRLDQILFSRNTKKVSLTKEGEVLFKHIEPAVSLIMRGENQITGVNKSGGVQLCIAASDTICRYYLVPYLKTFHMMYKDIHIKIINGTSLRCAELLQTNQADLIIANSPNPELNSNMHLETLKSFQDVFVYNPEYFHIDADIISFQELLNYPLLMLGKHSTTSRFLHDQFLKHSLDLVPSIELSSNDLLIDLAKIGLGIAFVPDFCIQGTEQAGDRTKIPHFKDLRIIHTIEMIPMRKLVAAYDGNISLSEASRFFIKLLSGRMD